MAKSNKKLLRSVIRQVHPDLFNTLPFERSHNSDNLKSLNLYVDALASGRSPAGVTLSFWTKHELELKRLEATLDGSLAPLYLAFGLVTQEEYKELAAQAPQGICADDVNLLQWLNETVQDAVATSDEHEHRKKLVRELKATIEFKYGLHAVRVGATYSSTTIDLARQLECLRVFEAFLIRSEASYAGLAFQLYHPWSAPSQTYQWLDAKQRQRMAAAVMNAHIGADGTLHIIADRSTVGSQIDSLDLEHARVLTRVNSFWARRQRDLIPRLLAILGVQNVWCDNRCPTSQEAFVLWAGRVLNASAVFEEVLHGRRFSFSILVHSDETSAIIDYMATSSVLQVRSDCAPQLLQEFLAGDTAEEAELTALTLNEKEDEEASLLAEVKRVFGAKHVIRVCSSEHKAHALAAARQLVAEADRIKAQVNLTGASIAIDDCYQVWESGFISIPHSFQVEDLQPNLAQLMGATASSNGKDGKQEGEPPQKPRKQQPQGGDSAQPSEDAGFPSHVEPREENGARVAGEEVSSHMAESSRLGSLADDGRIPMSAVASRAVLSWHAVPAHRMQHLPHPQPRARADRQLPHVPRSRHCHRPLI